MGKNKTSLKETELREELAYVGKRLIEEGLVHSNLGTISAALDKSKGRYLVKPGPLEYGKMGPDDFVEIDIAGTPKEAGMDGPSLNWLAHRACYETRPDITAVIHAHPDFVVALTSQANLKYSFLNPFRSGSERLEAIPLISEEAVWLYKPTPINREGMIPIADDLPPEALATSAEKLMREGNAFAIRNHGVLTVGKTLREALALTIELEHQAKILSVIFSMSGTPLYRSPAQVEKEAQHMPPWFTKPFQPSATN